MENKEADPFDYIHMKKREVDVEDLLHAIFKTHAAAKRAVKKWKRDKRVTRAYITRGLVGGIPRYVVKFRDAYPLLLEHALPDHEKKILAFQQKYPL